MVESMTELRDTIKEIIPDTHFSIEQQQTCYKNKDVRIWYTLIVVWNDNLFPTKNFQGKNPEILIEQLKRELQLQEVEKNSTERAI